MEKRERRGKPRHPAVVTADMQPLPAYQVADGRRVITFRRAEQRDRARPLGERTREFGEARHAAPPPLPSPAGGGGSGWGLGGCGLGLLLLKAINRRVTSWSCSRGGAARPQTQSKMSASEQSRSAS